MGIFLEDSGILFFNFYAVAKNGTIFQWKHCAARP